MTTGTATKNRPALRPGRLAVAGLGCGLLGFALTGTFHWAYLAALGSMFWLAVRERA